MPREFVTVAQARAQVKELEQAVLLYGRVDCAAQLAACYSTLGRDEEAFRIYELTWQKMRTPEIAVNMCLVLRSLGKHEAEWNFASQAFHLASEEPYMRMVYGESLLRNGLWRAAWPVYDTSRPTKFGERLKAGVPGKYREWDGRPLGENDYLLVLMEGGAGDRINYSRWTMLLHERVKHWQLYSYPEQAGFFCRLLGEKRVVLKDQPAGTGMPEGAQGWWTTVFSLPANFEATPTTVPQWYEEFSMRPSDAMRERYKINKPDDGLPVLGLCWEAAEMSPIGDPEARKVRSLTEAQAMRLVMTTADKVHWVSAQLARPLGWPMTYLPFETWEELGGLLANLDGLVCVDTGPMHLAGAMRVPLGILLGSNSDWKFGAKGRCPFYRDAALFRNGPGGGFDNAVSQAVAAIRTKGIEALRYA